MELHIEQGIISLDNFLCKSFIQRLLRDFGLEENFKKQFQVMREQGFIWLPHVVYLLAIINIASPLVLLAKFRNTVDESCPDFINHHT